MYITSKEKFLLLIIYNMKTIKIMWVKKYQWIIKLTKEWSFFTQCTRDWNATHTFPFKSFKTELGAYKYITKFLNTAS